MMNFFIAAFFIIVSVAPLRATELPIATGEWPPYAGAGLPEGGIATAVVTAACKAAGLPVSLTYFPWKRAEMMTASGKSFAAFPYKAIPERQETFLFSEPLFESYFAVLSYAEQGNARDFDFSGPESFTGFRVGTTVGTDAVVLPLQRAGVTVEETQTVGQALEMLRLGRIDFVIEDIAVARYAVTTSYPPTRQDRFIFASRSFGVKNQFCLMISMRYPNARALLNRFNEGLAIIRQDGTYASIAGSFPYGPTSLAED